MATNYFDVGSKLGGAYFEGKERGLQLQRQADEDARKKVIQGREDASYERAQTQIKDEDAAVQQYGLLNTLGKRNQPNIQANDTDFDMAVEATGRGLPMPAAQPQMPEYTPATDLDRNQGMQGIMRAKRDWGGVHTLQKEEKQLTLDTGRKAEYARLGKMKPEELASVLGDEFSKDGSGVDAMLTFDPKANKYLFASKVPGFPSQSLSRTELLNQAMGIWEAGNGDMKAGLAIVMDTLKTKRQLDDSNFNRSAKIAEGDAGLHFKGREADARDAKNKGDAAYQQGMLGISRERANATGKAVSPETTKAINAIVVQYQNSTDPKERARLAREFNVLQGQASTQLGRPMQLNTSGNAERAAFSQKDVLDLTSLYVGQPDPDAPKKTMDAPRARQVAMRELGGTQGGAVSDQYAAGLPMDDPRKAPALSSRAGQSGTHAKPSTSQAADTDARLRDIDMRLGLPGVSEETKLRLIFERQKITGNSGGMSLQNWTR